MTPETHKAIGLFLSRMADRLDKEDRQPFDKKSGHAVIGWLMYAANHPNEYDIG